MKFKFSRIINRDKSKVEFEGFVSWLDGFWIYVSENMPLLDEIETMKITIMPS